VVGDSAPLPGDPPALPGVPPVLLDDPHAAAPSRAPAAITAVAPILHLCQFIVSSDSKGRVPSGTQRTGDGL
jgi:hypothetical protein